MLHTNHALAPRMIGRQHQIDDLDAQLDLARRGAGRVVFVAGDAGVGKTRLLRSFIERAQGRGSIAVLEGACYDDDTAPYGPFIDVIRAAVNQYGADAAQVAGPWLPDLSRLLPELGASHSDAPDADPQIQKRRLFEGIHRIIRPQTEEVCHIIVLEDLHWSDQTSQELVRYLARAIERERVLILASYRTDEINRRHPLTHLIAQLTRERRYHEVRLQPLSHEELIRLIASVLDCRPPDGFSAALYERTEGNPFFTEEILRSLIEHGRLEALVQATRQGRVTEQPELPISIKDSVLRRTVELDEHALEVLHYAAVIGRQFDFELLLQLLGLDETALMQAIAQLLERQLVTEVPDSAGERYSFRHELTREAVYDDLLGRERRIRHRAVLHAIENLSGERADKSNGVDQLAYHSLQAREMGKAAHYARLAGDRAARLYAFREAVTHYQMALDALESDDPRERAELLDRLGEAAFALDLNLCTKAWREARQLYEQIGEQRRAADTARRLSRVAWTRGDRDAAFAYAQSALAALEHEPPGWELAMAYSALSQLSMLTGQHQQSIEQGEKAMNLASQLGDESVKAHALNNIGCSLVRLGQDAQGLAYLEESLTIARRNRLRYDALRAFYNLGGELLHLGYLQRSIELLHEGLAYVQQEGGDYGPIRLLNKLLAGEILLGHWDVAEQLIKEELQRTDPDSYIERRYVLVYQAELLLRRGQSEAAKRLLEDLRNELDAQSLGNACLPVYSTLARVYLELGALPQALTEAERLERTWRDSGCPADWALTQSDTFRIWLRAGRTEHTRALLAAIETSLVAPDRLMERATLDEMHALLAAHEGRHRDAINLFRRAVAAWQQLQVPYREADMRRVLAESLLQSGNAADRDAARQELAAARETFERLGAALDLKHVETVIWRYGLTRRTSRTSESDGVLTRREREVIALIAQGKSNREIAETLVISEKTAEVHVSNILGKLSFSSRAQAAAYAVEQGLTRSAS